MDTNFDGIAAGFEQEIYGSSKGHVRLGVLWEDLLSVIPELSGGGLRVLDAGGGAGQMALLMAARGNEVVLCDPSREMLRKAERSAAGANLPGSVATVCSPIQDLAEKIGGEFDVVCCHAVLEWLADPRGTLAHLPRFLGRDGRLSLMFYNRNAALLKRILKGEFAEALREDEEGFSPRGWADGAIPLDEETVREWLGELGLGIRSKAGIRIFHDHLPDEARGRLEDLTEVEKRLRKQEPFASLGQHVHLVCERARRASA